MFLTPFFHEIWYLHQIYFGVFQKRLKSAEIKIPELVVHNFYDIRIESENLARRRMIKEDIVFEDIYEVMKEKHSLNDRQIDFLMYVERQTEFDAVFPIEMVIKQINWLRKAGHKIIFASNMYLPAEFIKTLLIKVSAFVDGDVIYVSSDTGLSKRTGSLFRYIAKEQNCRFNQMTHFGDNLVSDIYAPSKLGCEIYKTSRFEIVFVLFLSFLRRGLKCCLNINKLIRLTGMKKNF